MAITVEQLVRELRRFRDSKEIVKALGKGLRKGVPPVRKEIRAAALEQLPHEGGLNKWVARIRINFSFKGGARSATAKLVGGRNSIGGRSDINAVDRGRVRAPSWGHRTGASWHTVTVEPGFFTRTAAESPVWRDHVDGEVDQALDQLRRG